MIHRLLLILLFFAIPSGAATVNASSCSAANINTAIGTAVNGDTVLVPGGSGSGAVTITGKYITLDFGGCSFSGKVTADASTGGMLRITNGTCTGSTACLDISGCGGQAGCGGVTTFVWEVDHMTFTNTAQSIFMDLWNNGPGLVTTNTFNGGAASEMIHNNGMGAGNNTGWTDDVTPGASNMIYIEGNTFTCSTGCGSFFFGTSAVQSYYGARTVFRYNTMNGAQVDQHGTCGNIGARWWEIYNNTFNFPGNLNQSNIMAIRDGSGVIFDNIKGTGTPSGSIEIEVTQDCGSGTYPLDHQIGRGYNEKYSPAYIWGNNASFPINSGSATYVQVNRDYFTSASQPGSMTRCQLSTDSGSSGACSTTYSYTPLAYPYPLGNATVTSKLGTGIKLARGTKIQ